MSEKQHAEPRQNPKVHEQESPSHNIEIGKKGERAAAKFLERRGYEILETNWKCKFGEADIIAEKDGVLVFVEVKTRTTVEKGFPEEAITRAKRKKYEVIAATYLQDHFYVGINVRFDVIALLVVAPDRAFLRHHVNAFGIDVL